MKIFIGNMQASITILQKILFIDTISSNFHITKYHSSFDFSQQFILAQILPMLQAILKEGIGQI